MMETGVKAEPRDEAEIQELSAKMVEANRARMANLARAAPAPPVAPTVHTTYLNRAIRRTMATTSTATSTTSAAGAGTPAADDGDAIMTDLGDEESIRGRFGWTNIGKIHIPYIIRSGEKYCAVRMVELRVLNKYLTVLHQDIYTCTCIRSYYITDPECRLLNEINGKHCDYQFGREDFSLRDLIVRLNDTVEFYKFLDSCYNKLINGSSSALDRCGFIRINKESVVPYTVYNGLKYVPLFYFEGETENLKLKAEKLEGWDLSYLKFCCKVQGIRNELFAHDSCSVIGVTDIKNYFPPGTQFEDYWPSKVVDSPLLTNGKVQTQMGQWTRQPAGAITSSTHPAPTSKVSTKTNSGAVQGAMFSTYGLNPGTITYPSLAARSAHPPRATYAAPTQPSAPAPSAPTAPAPPKPIAAAVNSQQMRPSYYVTTMSQSQPPPLIRAGQSTGYTNNHQTANYMMMNEQNVAENAYRPPPPSLHKFPPPLIPVRHINGAMRYDTQNHYEPTDAVDLSMNSNSATSSHPPTIINQQPAHQQSLSHQPHTSAPLTPQPPDDRIAITNGRLPPQSTSHLNLIVLEEIAPSGGLTPYKMQKALIDNRMITCINMKPFIYTDLLTTIPHLTEQLFSGVSAQYCHEVCNVLGINMYKGNSTQMNVLFEHGKCYTVNDLLPLVHVRQILNYLPQIKYMLSGLMSVGLTTKRRRAS